MAKEAESFVLLSELHGRPGLWPDQVMSLGNIKNLVGDTDQFFEINVDISGTITDAYV